MLLNLWCIRFIFVLISEVIVVCSKHHSSPLVKNIQYWKTLSLCVTESYVVLLTVVQTSLNAHCGLLYWHSRALAEITLTKE